MSEITLQVDSILTGALLMLVLLGLGIAFIMPGVDRWNRHFFITFYTVLVLYTVSILIEVLAFSYPIEEQFWDIIYYIETLSALILIPMMTIYLLHCCGEKWRRSTLFHIEAALWIISFILLNIAPFSTLFYSVTPEGQLFRGPLYIFLVLITEAMQVLNLACVIRWRSKLSKKFYAFLVCLLPLAIVLLIHCFVPIFEFLGIGISIWALTMFGVILFDQIDQYLLQQREIAHQNASIMVLQMRPHFIYNTMMSIYYLCKQDPDLAQQVTLDFNTYLRKNFTAIAKEELIHFSEELEHTRAYLAVEKAQFEDSLFVDYDTPYTDFRVPPLTLQPIVENAVKHGMDPDSEPLHIYIRTNRTDSGSEIIVENNGADFEPADDNEPHIALKNIQQRLEIMCSGKMVITPRKGGGTVVKVTIPRRQ